MPAELRIVCCKGLPPLFAPEVLKSLVWLVCVSVCECNRDGSWGTTVVFAVDPHPPMEARRPRHVCLCVWEKIKRQQTQVGFYCQFSGVCLFTRLKTRRGASQAFVKSAPARARSVLFIWFVLSRCVPSGRKAARVHLFHGIGRAG